MLLVSGQAWEEPASGPGGIRRKGGVSRVQAPTWNVGSCDSIARRGRWLYAPPPPSVTRPLPDESVVHPEIRRKDVTLQLLWLEYCEDSRPVVAATGLTPLNTGLVPSIWSVALGSATTIRRRRRASSDLIGGW